MQRPLVIAFICLLATLTIHADTFIVTNTNDSGSSSLREAIGEANTTPGADAIHFQIAGGGVKTITLTTALPQVTDVLTIDGFTQTGSSVNTSSTGLNSILLIEVDCNGGGFDGLSFTSTAAGSTVRGLAIGRCNNGIHAGANSNVAVRGTYLGTDATGTVARANATGIAIDAASSGNQIGNVGNDLGSRNLISGNSVNAMIIGGPSNAIIGNLIGTTASGIVALPNQAGITIRGNANDIGSNFVAASTTHGIQLIGPVTNNVIRDNAIGVGVNYTTPLGNDVGILVSPVAGDGPAGNQITNNIIRFNSKQGVALQNTDIFKSRGPATNAPGDPVRVRIIDNEIRDNGTLGIDLNADGVTNNDAVDEDTGPNDLQNFPALTSALASGGTLTITGTLNSTPSSNFGIQLFLNDACDASGYGEGAFFLGEGEVATDVNGSGSFTTSLPSAATTGVITAVAYDIDGNTSEFSACEPVVVPNTPSLSVQDVNVIEGNSGTSNATVTVTLSFASATDVQVNYATSDGSASMSSDYDAISGTLTFPAGVLTQTFLIPIAGDGVAEPDETIQVTLSSPSNATIDDGAAIVTITNDDGGAAPAAVPIPTLTEIGLTLFAAAIALLAFLRLR